MQIKKLQTVFINIWQVFSAIYNKIIHYAYDHKLIKLYDDKRDKNYKYDIES